MFILFDVWGEKLSYKYIRKMAYSIATGEIFSLNGFSGRTENVKFFKKYVYSVINLK